MTPVGIVGGDFDPEKPVAIVGAGVMGAKVAWACARSGLLTRVFDIIPAQAARSIRLAERWGTPRDRTVVAEHLVASNSLREAISGVQLIFESVPEKIDMKKDALTEIGALASEEAFLGSNTSSIMCAPLAEASGRRERFFNMNFTDPRTSRLVELMGSKWTALSTLSFARQWARHIGMVPIQTNKDQMGYSFNRLWRVIKCEVLRQIAEGSASAADIDRAWMLSFGTNCGPCGMMDDIGLHSVLAIERIYYEHLNEKDGHPPEFLEKMVERGELGVNSGKGFYSYPNPEYRCDDFLEGVDDASRGEEGR